MSADPRKVGIASVNDSETIQKYSLIELVKEECVTCERSIHMTEAQVAAYFQGAIENGFEFVMFECSECSATRPE